MKHGRQGSHQIVYPLSVFIGPSSFWLHPYYICLRVENLNKQVHSFAMDQKFQDYIMTFEIILLMITL